jgi:hypothetical protein
MTDRDRHAPAEKATKNPVAGRPASRAIGARLARMNESTPAKERQGEIR